MFYIQKTAPSQELFSEPEKLCAKTSCILTYERLEKPEIMKSVEL